MGDKGRVAIVGVSAYYAGPLARLLRQQGYETVGLARESSMTDAVEPFLDDLKKGDIADQNFVQQSTINCKAIINLVAQLNPPRETLEEQLMADMPAVDSCLYAGLKNNSFVIHTGGNFSLPTKGRKGAITEDLLEATYVPNPQGFPVRWPKYDHIDALQNFMYHNEIKHRAAEYVMFWTQVHPHGRACIVHPCATYGPGLGSRISFWDYTFERWLNGQYPDFKTGFIHVEDIARCYVALVENGESGVRYMAAGEPMRVSEFFDQLAAAADIPVPDCVNRYDNPDGLWYDDSRTRKLLGIEWQHSVKDSVHDLAQHLRGLGKLPGQS